MKQENRNVAFRFGLGLCLVYGVLVWALLWDQSLPFPLGGEDQGRIAAALGRTPQRSESGWVSELVDRGMIQLHPENPYPLLQHIRLTAGVLAMVGLSLWAGRVKGWLFGIWVALLSVGFFPLRIAATTLAPQAVCLAILVWGGMLSLGKPWSKTGTAEQFGGGALLGAACFAAPWGFLFGASIPVRALFSKAYRRRLERPFWGGFVVGLIPGAVWLARAPEALGPSLGFHPATLTWMKLTQFLELTSSSLGWFFLLFTIVGLYSIGRSAWGNRGWAVDFAWPVVVAMVLGHVDPIRSSLAFPGMVFLAAFGIEGAGDLFIDKTERKWLSTFLALMLGYHCFFGAMPLLRERQAHSREVKELAELIEENVSPGDSVALFRLNPLIDYLNTLHPQDRYRSVLKDRFPEDPTHSPDVVGEEKMLGGDLWIDPKRMGEIEQGLGKEYLEEFLNSHRTTVFSGNQLSELVRVTLK